jgi:hypothetical protein
MPCCGKARSQARPAPTVTQAAQALAAVITARRVSHEVIAERMRICLRCDHVRKNTAGYSWCALCGCRVDGKKGLLNLAAYEEGDGVRLKHGCHHPQRAEGQGWPPHPKPVSDTPPKTESTTP